MKRTVLGEIQRTQTHLFIVRVWLQDLGGGKAEWRGQVKQVMSGEVRYFRDWVTLIEYFQQMLPGFAESDAR
jgi:hypothetical protein